MAITRKICKGITNYNSKNSIAVKLRTKRIQPLLELIQSIYAEKGKVSIIDIGGTVVYWNLVSQKYLEDFNVNITIVNLPNDSMPKDQGRFKFVGANACDLSQFESQSFDIAHSNSVIEHVGDWEQMVLFAKELKRVASYYYCQTPNYWFPIEPHCMTPFFHWLPKPTRIWLVLHFQLGHWQQAKSIHSSVSMVESVRLLNKKMFQALFDDASIKTERVFLLPKSFVAIRNSIDCTSHQ